MGVTRRRELRDAGVERVVDIPSAEKRFEVMRLSGALSPAAAKTPDACVQLECGDQVRSPFANVFHPSRRSVSTFARVGPVPFN
jgi:hypothetical protein